MPGAKSVRPDAPTTDDSLADGLSVLRHWMDASQTYWQGMLKYTNDFYVPYLLATQYFQKVEALKLLEAPPADSVAAYLGLLENNIELMARSLNGAARMMERYARNETDAFGEAMEKTLSTMDPNHLAKFAKRQADLLDLVVNAYPKAIDAIAGEYGFHFERGEHRLADETDRFLLYQVSPSQAGLSPRRNAKPVLIIPPYVLGANILAFLPGEQRSYAHAFANQGYPTYIRILKDIQTSPALQTMRGEDDALDMRRFCETIVADHGKPVTLNGYCQGGFNALCALLSGKLDGLVDAFLTCVSPMDGTRSKGLARFLERLPERFNDLAYGTKTLANGNQVADGKLMGWVYKLKSIEQEIPAAAFYRDLMMFAHHKDGDQPISKTAAALNYWLQNERNDLPLEITRISFASYNTPITDDGTLPVRLFDGKLNLKRLQAKRIPWLICYGMHDDLVEKETALAPLDYIDAEVAPFPKGHVAIATSWSFPKSACALHTRFGDGNTRGPVRFHMDLDAALDAADRQSSPAAARGTVGTVDAQPAPSTAPHAAPARKNKPTANAKPAPARKAKPKARAATATRAGARGASQRKSQ